MKNHWIKSPRSEKYTGAISFVKKIRLEDQAIAAKVCVSSVGVYELKINEQKVSNRVLTPGFTSYNKRGIQYQEYEITDYLLDDNRICITVGPGWAVGHIGYGGNDCIYADHISATAQFVVTYRDGSEKVFFTDTSWEVFTHEVTFADIYHGETIDKTHAPVFLGMAQADHVTYDLIPDIGEAICEQETFSAVLLTTPKGEKVLDFGQNMTGYVALTIQGEKGSKVKLSFGEVLDKDGNFYNENYRTSRNEITYILSGNAIIR